jgi:hypothetical protein
MVPILSTSKIFGILAAVYGKIQVLPDMMPAPILTATA